MSSDASYVPFLPVEAETVREGEIEDEEEEKTEEQEEHTKETSASLTTVDIEAAIDHQRAILSKSTTRSPALDPGLGRLPDSAILFEAYKEEVEDSKGPLRTEKHDEPTKDEVETVFPEKEPDFDPLLEAIVQSLPQPQEQVLSSPGGHAVGTPADSDLVGAFGVRTSHGATEIQPAGLDCYPESPAEDALSVTQRTMEPGSESTTMGDLAVASPVSGRRLDIPHAREWLATDSEAKRSFSSRRWIRVYAAILIVIATIIAVTLTVVYTKKRESNGASEDDTNRLPAVQSPEDKFTSMLPDDTLHELQDPRTPQFKAFNWTISDPEFASYPPLRLMQRFVLGTIFYATGGDTRRGWISSDNWMSYKHHECSWFSTNSSWFTRDIYYNVSALGYDFCLDDDEEYRYLFLTANGLEGTLPPELYLLTSLKVIALEGNKLYGAISNHVGKLTNLTGLNLGNNAFSGSIPSEIGLLHDLFGLWLFTNDLTGRVPTEVGHMHSLEYIVLDQNGLSGGIPSEFGVVQSLVTLFAPHNTLTGPLPTEIGQLKTLQFLELDSNSLIGAIPTEIGHLEQLDSMSLSQNHLTGPIPTEIGELGFLSAIWLHGNHLTGNIPTDIGRLNNTIRLVLGGNPLSGTLPSELSFLQSNLLLALWDTLLSGTVPTELGRMSSLQGLALSNSYLSGPIPTELGSLSSMSGLSLFGNRISGSIPSELCKLTKLYGLQLNRNQIHGRIPSELGRLKSLELLDLSYNQLTGRLPTEIGDAKALQELRINNNQLTGALPRTLGRLFHGSFSWIESLAPVYMAMAVIPDIAFTALPTRSMLLGSNNFTGAVPSELGMMTELRNLNVAGNNLSGSIPLQLATLGLTSLNLSGNSFTGTIPTEFCLLDNSTFVFDCSEEFCGCSCKC